MGRLPSVGLRGRLALSIALILLVALGVTYVAVYRGTGSDLEGQTEADLLQQVDSLSRNLSAPPELEPTGYARRAERLVRAQPFGPSSSLIAISIEGAGTATNQPELLGLAPPIRPEADKDGGHSESSDDDDRESARRLLTSPEGFSTVTIEDVGDVRLLTRVVPLPGGGGSVIRSGQPLASVDRALDGLSRTFLLVGFLTLLASAAAGWFLASRTARPIRSMAAVAGGVDGGDLSARMPIEETRNDEVRSLAESFNHMLDRLEAAFTGQRAFVADASHDLRTPLTIVKGQLEVLARNPDPGPEEVRRVTAQVNAATDRMERLVDDLLLLARADSAAEVRLEESELDPLLSAETESFAEATDRQIEIAETSRDTVMIDRERIARAVSNLISNAVAHTEEGGRIEVSAVREGEWVVIAVDDDGPGIPARMRERVFDRFARLDSSRSTDSGGSGLGLAIVKAVAETHGGKARCSDSPLGGARFTISLPAA